MIKKKVWYPTLKHIYVNINFNFIITRIYKFYDFLMKEMYKKLDILFYLIYFKIL